jgi:hypothetical protein
MKVVSISKTVRTDTIEDAVKHLQELVASPPEGMSLRNFSIYDRFDHTLKKYSGCSVSYSFSGPSSSVDDKEEFA